MRILLVEDDITISSFLKKSFQEEGHTVDTTDDGTIGLSQAKCRHYDIILLDISVPGLSGREICKQLRLFGNKTPIIMLTAQHEVSTKVELLTNGADDYVTKPFSCTELIARMHAVLRRSSPEIEDENDLCIADLSIDTSKRLVKRNNTVISLSKKEYELLIYMINNRGKVLSRTNMLEEVWNEPLDVLSTTIDVHMCWLRKKIDTNSKKKLIHTIPGVGYKFETE